MKKPKIGEKIYIPSAFFVYRGEDDFIGGVATICKIEYSKHLPIDHINSTMVGIGENKGTMYNYKSLLKDQDELKEMFGDQVAHSDPDNRPEYNCENSDWKAFN